MHESFVVLGVYLLLAILIVAWLAPGPADDWDDDARRAWIDAYERRGGGQ